MEILADTTFLIDLQRGSSVAISFLERYSESRFYLSLVSLGELVPGFVRLGKEKLFDFVRPFPLVPISREIAWTYGELQADLRAKGKLIGSNDLWIAASAKVSRLTVLTKNTQHFKRVPDLEVLEY